MMLRNGKRASFGIFPSVKNIIDALVIFWYFCNLNIYKFIKRPASGAL